MMKVIKIVILYQNWHKKSQLISWPYKICVYFSILLL